MCGNVGGSFSVPQRSLFLLTVISIKSGLLEFSSVSGICSVRIRTVLLLLEMIC